LKKIYILGVIFVLLSFLGFYLIETMFTIKPDVISGNGNLGILVILLLFPICIASYYFTYKMGREISYIVKKRIIRVLLLSLCLTCNIILAFLIMNYTSDLIIALGGKPSNPESKIYRFGWFNQYTNSMFFNTYTFLLTHIIAVTIGIIPVKRTNL
jgi:hypothetical protein